MFTFESGKRPTSPHDRAHDYLANHAHTHCNREDIEAALRVLRSMTDRKLMEPLYAAAPFDSLGNPVAETDEELLAYHTWSAASELIERLGDVLYALEHGRTTS